MIISARPYPSIKTLFSSPGYFDFSRFEFHSLGREALLHCVIKLGLQIGDKIIIPAYICESSIKPLRSYGFNLIFIDINNDLSIPIDKLKILISDKKIKALLLVHYFGLLLELDDIVALCDEFSVKVVEDASHGLMSQLLRNKKNIMGDAEVFSMRKNLPILDGGAFRINRIYKDEVKISNNKYVSIILEIKYLILRFFEKFLAISGINIYSQWINNTKTKLRNHKNDETYNHNIEPYKPSWQLSKYLGDKNYIKSSQIKIIQNFTILSYELKALGFRLFADSLEDNIVPQVCIIYDDKGGLIDHLRSKGIGAYRWPDMEILDEVKHNPSQYPNTVFFDKNLALIPIHQSIGMKEINHIVKVLTRWQL